MKTVFCRIMKTDFIGGEDVRICYTASRGGRTEASYRVMPRDLWRPLKEGEVAEGETWTIQPEPDQPPEVYVKRTPEEVRDNIAKAIGDTISRTWQGEMFGCKVRGNELILTCMHDDISFYGMLNGVEDNTVIEVEG